MRATVLVHRHWTHLSHSYHHLMRVCCADRCLLPFPSSVPTPPFEHSKLETCVEVEGEALNPNCFHRLVRGARFSSSSLSTCSSLYTSSNILALVVAGWGGVLCLPDSSCFSCHSAVRFPGQFLLPYYLFQALLQELGTALELNAIHLHLICICMRWFLLFPWLFCQRSSVSYPIVLLCFGWDWLYNLNLPFHCILQQMLCCDPAAILWQLHQNVVGIVVLQFCFFCCLDIQHCLVQFVLSYLFSSLPIFYNLYSS